MGFPSFNLSEVPKLTDDAFGKWRLLGEGVHIATGEGWGGDCIADVWVWRTPRFQVAVLALLVDRGTKGHFYGSHSERLLAVSELHTDSFGRLDVGTRVDAFKLALAQAALTLVPTLAWLYDALGVRR